MPVSQPTSYYQDEIRPINNRNRGVINNTKSVPDVLCWLPYRATVFRNPVHSVGGHLTVSASLKMPYMNLDFYFLIWLFANLKTYRKLLEQYSVVKHKEYQQPVEKY